MEEKLSFFAKIKVSLFNFKSYSSVLKQSSGQAIIYILLLTLIFGGIGGVRPLFDANSAIDDLLQSFNSDIPEFVLSNGELEVQGKMPMVLSREDNSAVIIDTSGQTSPDILENYTSGFFVYKTGVINKKSAIETSSYDFSKIKTTITKADVQKYLPYIKFIIPFIAIFGFISSFIGNLLRALILAILGKALSKFLKYKIEFKELFKLSIYASTPLLLIESIFSLAKISFPFAHTIYIAIGLFYLYKVIKELRSTQNTPDVTNFYL